MPHLNEGLKRIKSDIFGSWVPFVVLSLILLFTVCLQGWISYQSATDKAEEEAQNLAFVLSENLNQSLESTDRSLSFIASQITPTVIADAASERNQSRITELLGQQVELNPLLSTIRIANAKGDQIYSAVPNENRANYADREYFVYLRDHPETNSYFSQKIIISKHAHLPVLAIAKPIRSKQGDFSGIVVMVFPISSVQQIFEKIKVGAHGVVLLRASESNQPIYRQPQVVAKGQYNSPSNPIQMMLDKHLHEGSVKFTSVIDDVSRMYSFRKVSKYPYIIVVGLAEKDYLQSWYRNLAYAIFGAIFLDALVGILYFRHRRANQALKESLNALVLGQEKLKLVNAAIANANDVVVITEAEPIDGFGPRIVYVNEAFTRETGFSPDEAIGRTPRILQGPKTDRATLDLIHTALQKWRPIRADILNYKKNGGEIWQELNIFPIADEKGWFTHWVSIQRNITERKLAEEAFTKTSERLALAVRAGSVGIWDWDILTNALDWDEQMYKLYGTSNEQFSGAYDAWTKGLHPDDRNHAELELEKALAEEGEYNSQFRVIWPDGTIHHLHSLGTVERDANGKPIRVSGTNWDITELTASKTAAEAALAAKTQFLSNMSHEIRTPMNGIIGLSTLALNQPLSPQVHDYLISIESSAKSLLNILNDVLDFSKLEAGKVTLNQTPFQIQELFVNIQHLFEESAKAKGLELVLSSGVDLATPLVGDPFRIGQVLNNLIGNAIKFTEQGSVNFSVGLRGMENSQMILRFSVKDTGIGIPVEILDKLMQPFTQADGSITRRFGGTGLGLSICSQLLELMDSKLTVTSTEGDGASFSFDLVLGTKIPT